MSRGLLTAIHSRYCCYRHSLGRTLEAYTLRGLEFANSSGAHLQPISRWLRALVFLIYGFAKITGFNATATMMASAGIPAPTLFLIPSIMIELAGGLALLVGYQTRLAALGLTLYLIPVTLVMHAAHLLDPGPAGQQQMVQVLKNLAIMGGLLKFVTDGPGAYSLDVKAYCARLVDGPVLKIPIQMLRMRFNPSHLRRLGSLGAVYTDLKVTDAWGVLTVSRGALIDPSFSTIRVAAPKDLNARPVRGDGWALELNAGWVAAPAGDNGDYLIKKD